MLKTLLRLLTKDAAAVLRIASVAVVTTCHVQKPSKSPENP